MKLRILFLLVLLFSSANLLIAQTEKEEIPINIGVYGAGVYNLHSPDFIYDYPEESPYFRVRTVPFDESAGAFSFAGGLIGNFPINEMFVISGRLGYNGLNGVLGKTVTYDVSEPAVDTTLDYEMKGKFSYLELSPILKVHNLVPVENLYLLGGLELGFPISMRYDLTETAQAPVEFPGGGSERTTADDAELSDAQLRLAAALGVGYMFEISDDIFLTPELSFRYPFTGFSTAESFDSWSAPQIRLGVSLTFGLKSKDKRDFRPGSSLEVGFKDIRYYDREGSYFKLEKIKVDDVQYTELFPLIPYVFFEENKAKPRDDSQILKTETAETGEFNIAVLPPDAEEINMRTLDIVGERMRENPDAFLTVTGAKDSKTEASNASLPMQRAEFVKDYVVKNYGVDPSRITTEAINSPENPSSSRVPEGVAENRRAELTGDEDLLYPLMIKNETQRISEPNVIEFIPYANSSDSIVSWALEIGQADDILRVFEGVGEPRPIQWIVMPDEMKASQIPLEYSFRAENESGLSREVSGTVPVDYYSTTRKQEEELADKTISKFSLILFDFDKADVSKMDMKIIRENVLPAVEYNSTVQIYGYTDKIGDASYNQKLAKRRAEAVMNVLKKEQPKAKYEIYGVGEHNAIFDNDVPIGRQLSRTVQIYVITPTGK